jgi:uncharacterized RDD family membrane protein YckC
VDCTVCGAVNPDTALRCECGHEFTAQTVQTAPIRLPSARANLASRGNRLVGQLIDACIALGIFMALFLPSMAFQGSESSIIAPVLGLFGYHLFADGLKGGQSYGKRVVKTRVIDQTTGAPCTFGKSFLRNLVLIVLGVIDWVFIFGRKRQRLGDKLAGTIVINAIA